MYFDNYWYYNLAAHNLCKEDKMKVLSAVGAMLFIVLCLLGILLQIFEPKWYWERFIPKLHKKEEQHPVITVVILLLLVILMMYGIMSTVR